MDGPIYSGQEKLSDSNDILHLAVIIVNLVNRY